MAKQPTIRIVHTKADIEKLGLNYKAVQDTTKRVLLAESKPLGYIPDEVYHFTKRTVSPSILKDKAIIRGVDGVVFVNLTEEESLAYLTEKIIGVEYIIDIFNRETKNTEVLEDYCILKVKPIKSKRNKWYYHEKFKSVFYTGTLLFEECEEIIPIRD